MGWRWMFGAELVPAVVFLVLMFFVPESPRWLVKAGKPERARAMLQRIGSAEYAGQTLKEIEHTLIKDNHKVAWSTLLQPQIKPIVIIGMVLAVFQQWCGINVIFNYAQEIFASAGFDINGTLKSIVATGIINFGLYPCRAAAGGQNWSPQTDAVWRIRADRDLCVDCQRLRNGDYGLAGAGSGAGGHCDLCPDAGPCHLGATVRNFP